MDFVDAYKRGLLKALETLELEKVRLAITWLREARDQGHRIFTCGNGGSCATASHLVTDLAKGASYRHARRFRALSLVDSSATLTAYTNDVAYDIVFSEQLQNFAQPGDVLVAISCSGNSPNIVEAVRSANGLGCRTIALTGHDGGEVGRIAKLNILVSEPHMGRIEDVHLIVAHMLAYAFIDRPSRKSAPSGRTPERQ
jgi:D-sedoheptulose 7-phosphate isomerase